MKYLVDQQWAREVEATSPEAALQKALQLRRGRDAHPELFHVYQADAPNRGEWHAFEVEANGTIKDVS
jgi:hypothetical protein